MSKPSCNCAAAAFNRNDAIIAVVDRNGTILGVRVESGVSTQITADTTNLVLAIDGAVSLARRLSKNSSFFAVSPCYQRNYFN